MAVATYNYETGKIERSFKFIKFGSVCRLRGVPVRTGNNICLDCPFCIGWKSPWELRQYGRFEGEYVMCEHKDAEDIDCSFDFIYAYSEYIKHEALKAL